MRPASADRGTSFEAGPPQPRRRWRAGGEIQSAGYARRRRLSRGRGRGFDSHRLHLTRRPRTCGAFVVRCCHARPRRALPGGRPHAGRRGRAPLRRGRRAARPGARRRRHLLPLLALQVRAAASEARRPRSRSARCGRRPRTSGRRCCPAARTSEGSARVAGRCTSSSATPTATTRWSRPTARRVPWHWSLIERLRPNPEIVGRRHDEKQAALDTAEPASPPTTSATSRTSGCPRETQPRSSSSPWRSPTPRRGPWPPSRCSTGSASCRPTPRRRTAWPPLSARSRATRTSRRSPSSSATRATASTATTSSGPSPT